MRLCSCGRRNADDQHYCECGAYLGFDAVTPEPAAAAAGGPDSAATQVLERPAAVAPDAAASRGAVILLMRSPGDERYVNPAEPPPRVRVAAGGRAVLHALIRNQGDIVDNYDLRIEGADGWWTVLPATADLIPFGTREGYEQELDVQLHPARTSQAEARVWSLTLVARSRALGRDVARAPLEMEIEPYWELTLGIGPQIRSGRRRARFTTVVHNRGNAVATIRQGATDSEDACSFSMTPAQLQLPPAAVAHSTLTALPRSQILVGRPQDHRFEASCHLAEQDDLLLTGAAVFRQRSWLPWWLAILAVLLVAAIAVLIALLGTGATPAVRATIPDLRPAANRLAAQRMLEDRGLKLSDDVRLGHARYEKGDRSVRLGRHGRKVIPAWAITAQSPSAGQKVKRGTKIVVKVQAPRRVRVPSVIGLSQTGAERRLMEAWLKLGEIKPDKPGPRYRIVSQLPKAGTRRRRTVAVSVVLAKPRSARGGAKSKAVDASKTRASAKRVAVPDFETVGLKRYARGLDSAGLRLRAVRRISSLPRGTVLVSAPAPGRRVMRGSQVRIVVSAGFPRLAFDDGSDVLLAGGARGMTARPLATGPPALSEPTWSPAGDRVAYRADGRLLITAADGRSAARQLTPPSATSSFAHPAFAPTRARDVLAFVRDGETDALCLTGLGAHVRQPSCAGVAGWALGSISWAPNGRSLLVAAQDRDDPGHFGLLRFTSPIAYSARASSWRSSGALVTPAGDGRGVRTASISPDGRRLAAITNLAGGAFRLAITRPTDVRLADARTLRVAACDVAWRPDGAELAVVQADAACASSPGSIVRLSPTDPTRVLTVAPQGADPAWEPLALGSR